MRSFKSNENIHKKEGGSYYVVAANKDCFDENGEEITTYTKHIKMILAQYPIRQTTTTFLWLRQI